MIDYIAWTIILDDVIFPDGRSEMGRIGGGGLYAAMGMRIWSEHVAIASRIGEDFDPQRLDPLRLDTSLLVRTPYPTLHSWQIYEPDGHRHEYSRLKPEAAAYQILPEAPPEPVMQTLIGAHQVAGGGEEREHVARQMIDRGIFVGAEPFFRPQVDEAFRHDILSGMAKYPFYAPNEAEMRIMIGERSIPDGLRALADYGPPVVGLRRGEKGSVIYDREARTFWRVPAAPVTVADVTGGGNAWMGGYIVGWTQRQDIRHAAACASVSAAMVIEQVGPPAITPEKLARARALYDQILPHIQPIEEW
ncbi:MAG: hypothetical protein IT326_09895 [Anaerolineae bacterium]|nr:hypothetical protein [Anaerolineae bacterium]